MGRKKRRCAGGDALAAGVLLTCGIATVSAGERLQVATNDQALQLWAQATGSRPDVTPTDDGGLRVEWKVAVIDDLKRNTTTGNTLTTGTRPGNFNTIQFRNEYRAADSQNNLSWLLLNATNSNDRGLQTLPNLINTLQFGRVGEGYRLAAGDVPVNFSSLGSSVGIRGFYGERVLGRLGVAAAGGVITNSWDNLVTPDRRTQYLREAYSLRAAYPWSEALNVFATAQAYQDVERSLSTDGTRLNQITALAPAKGQTVTAGLNWRSGSLSLSGEGGASHWEEKGLPRRSDTAYLLRSEWQKPQYSLHLGHHDLGVYYTSLSGQALPGVRETYGRANWLATPWLSLNGDVRRSLNRRVAVLPPVMAPPVFPGSTPTPVPAPVPVFLTSAMETDAVSLGATVTVLPVPGLSVNLQRSQSDIDSGSGPNRNQMSNASLSYVVRGWTAGLGVTLQESESDGMLFANDSEVTTVNYSLGKRWVDPVAQAWNYGVNGVISDQRTTFESGNQTSNVNFSLAMDGQHGDLGRGGVTLMLGTTRDPLNRTVYDTRAIRLEYGRTFSRAVSMNLYLAVLEFASNNDLIGYKDRSGGLQIAYQNW